MHTPFVQFRKIAIFQRYPSSYSHTHIWKRPTHTHTHTKGCLSQALGIIRFSKIFIRYKIFHIVIQRATHLKRGAFFWVTRLSGLSVLYVSCYNTFAFVSGLWVLYFMVCELWMVHGRGSGRLWIFRWLNSKDRFGRLRVGSLSVYGLFSYLIFKCVGLGSVIGSVTVKNVLILK